MSKKPTTLTQEEEQRQSRKEVLLARKQSQQTRQLRLGVAAVAGLVILVFLVAIVNEFFIAPNRTIASVNGEPITIREWQQRVIYERAQRILFLENQLEAFGGDVGIIQQFAGQAINELTPGYAETLGADVLARMENELMARQAAEARGITVTEAEIDERIGQAFAYYDGESPTPIPTATETVMPTPSLTPIPTAVITEVVPTTTPFPTPTTGPTATPRPTATPVSLESFQTELESLLQRFQDLGVSEETYRATVKAQIYQDKLADALAVEEELQEEAVQASVFLLTYTTEEAANEGKAMIEAGDFLTVWNTVRSAPFDPNIESTASATEILWRTQTEYESSIGASAAAQVFSLELDAPSDILANEINEETTRYYILMVSGREERPLSEAAINQQKEQILTTFLDGQLGVAGVLQFTESWRSRVPIQPVLDAKFYAEPTAAPPTPTIPLVNTPAPEPTPDGS